MKRCYQGVGLHRAPPLSLSIYQQRQTEQLVQLQRQQSDASCALPFRQIYHKLHPHQIFQHWYLNQHRPTCLPQNLQPFRRISTRSSLSAHALIRAPCSNWQRLVHTRASWMMRQSLGSLGLHIHPDIVPTALLLPSLSWIAPLMRQPQVTTDLKSTLLQAPPDEMPCH